MWKKNTPGKIFSSTFRGYIFYVFQFITVPCWKNLINLETNSRIDSNMHITSIHIHLTFFLYNLYMSQYYFVLRCCFYIINAYTFLFSYLTFSFSSSVLKSYYRFLSFAYLFISITAEVDVNWRFVYEGKRYTLPSKRNISHCFIWVWNLVSDTQEEEHRLRVFYKRVLRRIFWPKMEQVEGGWRRLHIEELHNLHASPNVIRVIKLRKMWFAEHVACLEEKRNAYKILVAKHERNWGFLRTQCWGRYLDLKGRKTDCGENCIVMNFTACILHRILLGWLNQGGWGGRNM
jgi:hypothetical protein